MNNLRFLKQVFAPEPAFDDQGDRQMMLGVLGIALAVDVFMVFVDANTWIMLIFGALLTTSLVMAWRGHLTPSRVLVPLAALTMFGFLMFQNFGLRDTAVLGLPIAVLLASLLIGRRSAALYGLLSAGLVIALGVAESHGVIHNPMSVYNTPADYITVGVSLILITALQWLVVGRLNDNLKSARRNADAQHAANEALRVSEARQRALLSAIPELVFRLRRDGVFLDYHAPQVDRLVAPPEAFIGKSVQAVMPPNVADQAQRFIEQVLTTGQPAEFEYALPVKEQDRCFEARMVMGGAHEVFVTVRDITERKRLESLMQLRLKLIEFAESHSLAELLQHVLDEVGELTGSPIGFCHFVEADQRTLALQAWSTRTRTEFCQAEGEGLHYPLDKAGVWADCVRERRPIIHNDYQALPHRKGLPEGHADVIRELVVPIIKDDRIAAILGVGNRAQDYTENDVALVSYVADLAWEITERKQTAQKLQMFQYTVDQASDAVQWLNRDARFEYVNEQACRSLGYTRDELMRLSLWDIDSVYPKERWELNWAGPRDSTQVGEDYAETLHRRKDGSVFPVEVLAKHLWFGDKELHVAVVRDITERKRVEEDLKRYAAQAQQRAEQLSMLVEVGRVVSTLRDLDSVLEVIYQQARRSLSLDVFMIALLNAETNMLEFPIMYDSGRRWQEAARLLDVNSLLGRVVERDEPQLLNRTASDLKEPTFARPLLGDKSKRSASLMFAPLRAGAQIIGVISVQSYTLDAYDQAALALLVGIAHQAAIAIDNARLYSAAQQELAVRERAEQALRESEALYQSLVEVMPMSVCRKDASGRFTFINQRYCQEFKRTPAEILGKTDFELHPRELAEKYQLDDRAVMTSGRTLELVEEHAPIGGPRAYMQVFKSPVYNAHGEVTGVQIVFWDVSDRKQAEEALRASEAKLQLAFEAARLGDWSWDIVTNAVSWSAQCKALYGLPPDTEMTYARFLERVHPEDREDIDAALRRAVETKGDYDVEKRAVWPDGSIHWTATRGRVVCDAAGQPVRLTGITLDITERKQAEEALRNSQQMLRNVLDQFPGVVFWKDRQSVYLGCNRAFSEAAGLADPAEIIGKTDLDLPWAATEAAAYRADDNTVISSQQPRLGVIEPQHQSDGRVAWFDTAKVPLFDEQNNVIGVLGTSRDITEQVRTLQTLRETEEKYRRLIEVSPVAMWINQDGIITYMNPAALRILKATDLQQVVDRPVLDFIHPDYHATVKGRIAQMADHEQVAPLLEEKYIRLDGSAVDVEVTATPFATAGGRAMQVLFQDITERKRAEAQVERTLRETRVRLEVSQALAGKETEDEVLDALIELAGFYAQAFVVILTFDRHEGELVGIVRRQNPYASGLTAALPVGEKLAASRYTLLDHFSTARLFVSEDVRIDERFEPAGREILGRTGAASYAAIPLTVGNEWLGYIAVMARPVGYFDEEKQHLYQTLAEQGAVALRAARLRETIRESQQRLSLLVQQSPLGIIEWNLDMQVVAWNPAAERIFSHDREDALGRTMDFIVPEDVWRFIDSLWQAVLAKKGGVNNTNDNLTKNGRRITCDWFNAPLVGADGQVIGVVSFVQDITERKQAELERERLIAELESRNAELERFVYTVSHDLKSPLITIRGFLGFLMKDALAGNTERLSTDIQRISGAADKMQQLLNDLLELSRIGRMMNPPVDVPFEEVVREALDLLQGRLTAHPVQVEIVTPLPVVHGDRARLVEVMQNLIDNAVKFACDQPDPRIEIGVRTADSASQPIFFVRDNGIGIEPQYHERVFGLFNKLDAHSEGTGVGLALVKRIVEVHGGRIWVESAGYGHGSTFWFTLAARTEKIDRAS